MKRHSLNPVTNLAVKITLLIAFAFLFLPRSEAQQGGKPVPPPTTSPVDRVDMQMREMQMKSLELTKEGERKVGKDIAPETLKNVKEDFSRLQEINAEIMRVYTSGNAPNYSYLAEATAEVNKRASRLKSNLLLPEVTGKEQKSGNEADKQQAQSPLMTLNRLISSFVTNPIFQSSNTIDAEQGGKARRDLESIIELSDKIRKSAEKLSKSPGKSN